MVILIVPALGDLLGFKGDDMTQGVGEVLLFSSFPRYGEWGDVYGGSCLKTEDQDNRRPSLVLFLGETENSLHLCINGHQSDFHRKLPDKPVAVHFNRVGHAF